MFVRATFVRYVISFGLLASGLIFDVGFSVAERVIYTPSVGYCLLLVLALDRLLSTGDEQVAAESDGHGSKDRPASRYSRTKGIVVVITVVVIALYAARFAMGV